jgi:hypothetical protein
MVAMRSWIGDRRDFNAGNREHGSLLQGGAMRVL